MSLFGKKPDSQAAPGGDEKPEREPRPVTPPPPAPAPTRGPGSSFLGAGCRLEGEIRGEGSLEFRGEIVGTIDVEGDVTVGHDGRAEAKVTARRIVIEGTLEGDAIGGEKVEVAATGHVEGDVRAPTVMFQEGAFFEGNVEMHRSKAAPSTQDDDAEPDEETGSSGG